MENNKYLQDIILEEVKSLTIKEILDKRKKHKRYDEIISDPSFWCKMLKYNYDIDTDEKCFEKYNDIKEHEDKDDYIFPGKLLKFGFYKKFISMLFDLKELSDMFHNDNVYLTDFIKTNSKSWNYLKTIYKDDLIDVLIEDRNFYLRIIKGYFNSYKNIDKVEFSLHKLDRKNFMKVIIEIIYADIYNNSFLKTIKDYIKEMFSNENVRFERDKVILSLMCDNFNNQCIIRRINPRRIRPRFPRGTRLKPGRSLLN